MADDAVEEITNEEETDDLGLREQLELAIDGDDGVEGGDEGESQETEPSSEGSPAPKAEGEVAGEGEHVEPSPAGAKPPIDWGPELKEKWGTLSDDVRSKIAERESQIAQAMQGTAQARRIAQDFTAVANQYGSVMAAEGVQNPVQMFDSVMRTVSELRMGTTQQKAQTIANLIQAYGVDIETLDGALAGAIDPSAAPSQAGSPDLEALLDQRLAPVNQMMQQLAGMQQQKQHVSQQEAVQEVNEFASTQEGEFLDHVRNDVADLLDLATRQNRQMTLKEAYDKACAMNPEINRVLEQRRQQQSLVQGQQSLASKRNAASTLRPGNNRAPKAEPQSLYDSISAAWDEQIG